MTPRVGLPILRWIAGIAARHLSTMSTAIARAPRLSCVPDVFGSGNGQSDLLPITMGNRLASKSATARPSTCEKSGAGSVRI